MHDQEDENNENDNGRINKIKYLKDSMEALIKRDMKKRLEAGNFLGIIVLDEEERVVMLCRHGFKKIKKVDRGIAYLGHWLEIACKVRDEDKMKSRVSYVYRDLLPTRVTTDGKIYVYAYLNKDPSDQFFNDHIGIVKDVDRLIPSHVKGAAVEVMIDGFRKPPSVVKYHGSVYIPNEILPSELSYHILEDNLSHPPLRSAEMTLNVLVGEEMSKQLRTEQQRERREYLSERENRERARHFPAMVMNEFPPRSLKNVNTPHGTNDQEKGGGRASTSQSPSNLSQDISKAASTPKLQSPGLSNSLPTVFITNTGFELGSNLAKTYLENNYNVVIHNCASDVKGDIVRGMMKVVSDRLELVSFDLLNLDEVKVNMAKLKSKYGHIDLVIHIAMAKTIGVCEEKDFKLHKFLMDHNVNSTRYLFTAMHQLSYNLDTGIAVITNLEDDKALIVPETVRAVEKWLEFIVYGFKRTFKEAIIVTTTSLYFVIKRANDPENWPHIRHLSNVLKALTT